MVLADRFPNLYRADAPPMETVLEAARIVIAAVQERLWHAGGPGATLGRRYRPGSYARSLWDAQWQAHAAIVAKAGNKRAKTVQAEAAAGMPPLSVCVGHRLRRFPDHEQVLRFNAPDMLDDPDHPGYVPYVPLGNGDGCGAIILDTLAPRPLTKMPKRYCDRCAAQAQRTLNGGLAKNALSRLRDSRGY